MPVSSAVLSFVIATAVVLSSCSRGETPAHAFASWLASAAQVKPVTPESLIDLVQEVQSREVKMSTGEWAYQCVTEIDLRNFLERKRHLQVAREVRSTARFRNIVKTISGLSNEQREALLRRARTTAHPTWAQLGRITSDGSGQTEAGQREELLLANAICDAIEEELRDASGAPL